MLDALFGFWEFSPIITLVTSLENFPIENILYTAQYQSRKSVHF